MKKYFNVGDDVICINNYKSADITIGKYYTIIQTGYDKEFVCLSNDKNINRFYDVANFTIDIKLVRKLKLEKICLNQEIK